MVKVIRISEGATLALHSLGIIAKAKGDIKANKIAEVLQCSYNHLAKVLHKLAVNGYLSSTRGPQGGFVLKRAPEKYSILEIVELIDGKIEEGGCDDSSRSKCTLKECCFDEIKARFARELRDYLKKITLAEYMKK